MVALVAAILGLVAWILFKAFAVSTLESAGRNPEAWRKYSEEREEMERFYSKALQDAERRERSKGAPPQP